MVKYNYWIIDLIDSYQNSAQICALATALKAQTWQRSAHGMHCPKISTILERIAQIYLPHLLLFASLAETGIRTDHVSAFCIVFIHISCIVTSYILYCCQMYFCIVARCISSATLIQICCTRARFCPRCSYVQNTVGANITKFAWDLYLARSTYKSGEARCQDAKLYRQNRILTTCGWAQKQIATLSLLCWRHIGNIFMGKTNQNRHLYATLKISKLGAMDRLTLNLLL